MKLDYIYHSGFAIETNDVTVLIDYWKDSPDESGQHLVCDCLLHSPCPLYVLATHFHPDHFNPEVLSWRNVRPDIRYIFSKDILRHRRASRDDAIYINKGGVYEDDHLRIQAFGSTDVGVSFLLDLQNIRLFHAGDLNNWHWSEESTPQEIRKAEGDYLAEIRDLQQVAPSVDVALFPVDRRMGKDYMRGAQQFVERIKTRIFVPMHFGDDYEGGNAFRPQAETHGCHFLTISRRGQSFDIQL